MTDKEEKIQSIIIRLNNIQGDIDSYIKHSDVFQDKYSLEDVLPDCNAIKQALLQELESLGGTWPVPLD